MKTIGKGLSTLGVEVTKIITNGFRKSLFGAEISILGAGLVLSGETYLAHTRYLVLNASLATYLNGKMTIEEGNKKFEKIKFVNSDPGNFHQNGW